MPSKDWFRDVEKDRFLCSTNREYIQLDALNAALGSDLMWWAQKLAIADLEKIVSNSLCFALYRIGPADGCNGKATASGQNGVNSASRRMIGFARIITDHVTFGYMTDVYVLEEFQGRGLCKWMMQCLNEVLSSLPALRRFLLMTRNERAAGIYQVTLGATKGPSKGMTLFERLGNPTKVPPPQA